MVSSNYQKLYIIGVLFGSCVFAFEKHWIKSNAWNDPSNWKPPRLPCPNDNIVLQNDVVYIEQNVTIKSQLVLPTDGEIIFGPNSNMIFEEKPERNRRSISTCSKYGADVSFVGQQQKNWLNPMNWEIYSNGKKDEYLTKAAPFVERVPCRNDKISFPSGNAFEVDIAEEVTVKDIMIDGQSINNDADLQSYLVTAEGERRFKFSTSASLKLDPSAVCDNKSGCKCIRDDMFMENICSTFKCPAQISCTRKVRPLNDCCDRCGALINFIHRDGFDFDMCWKNLRSYLNDKSSFVDVRLYMIPVKTNNIEVLLSEDNDGINAESAAKSIGLYLNNSKICGHVKAFVKPTIPGKEKHTGDKSTPSRVVLAIVLPILIVLLIVIVGIILWRKRCPVRIKRQRFDNENDFTQYPGVHDIETDFSSPDVIKDGVGTTQFANPLYEHGVFEENEDSNNKNDDDVASPEYSIPINYLPKKNKDIEPRYVEGHSNPTYGLDAQLDPDDVGIELDGGNANPLYDEMFKSPDPDKQIPNASEVDLHSTEETDSIKMKLELKLKELSDTEEYENEVEDVGKVEKSFGETF